MKKLTRRTFVRHASTTFAAATLAPDLFSSTGSDSNQGTALKLWFNKPSATWADALPIGNGHLGAMVFGGDEQASPSAELLQLNESTLWSGRPRDGNNLVAKQYLPAVRAAVLKEENYHLADDLTKKMQGKHTEAYQPLGNLRIKFQHAKDIEQYRRELDLDTACARTSYVVGNVKFEREAFCSAPDKLLAFRVKGSSPASVGCRISLDAELGRTVQVEGDKIILVGKAPAHFASKGHPGGEQPLTFSDVPGEGMSYVVIARVIPRGGRLSVSGNAIEIDGADTLTILVSASTGFRGFNHLPDRPVEELRASALQSITFGSATKYDDLRLRHIEDHQRLFHRVSLDLGSSSEEAQSTDQRLASFATTQDPALIALYFQYGRYLLISCSRPGSQPANLQGLWNNLTIPPWGCNWTTNINLQMNYWPAETCNLSECASPLFDFIRELSVNGARTASESYGLPGWCAHHNADLWRSSNSVGEGTGDPTWASWNMSGPWLCAHLYEHYRFTNDLKFLREQAYPLMRGSAEFCHAWLIEDGNGHLTTCPSESTENNFMAPDGKPAMTSAGCTMDRALIRELFNNCIHAASLLNVDADFSKLLANDIKRLVPYQIGSHGQLQEWSIDFVESKPGQRHMSHMYPLYPGCEITPRDTPDLARAARISLERRLAAGGAYTGWSRAWAINFWARLYDGDKAGESLSMLMQHSTNRNLFDTHPATPTQIFQIDGNFGATAAVAEMLLQSHTDSIDLLPALPSLWSSGSVSGLRARGAISVALVWKQGRVVSCSLTADKDTTVKVRFQDGCTVGAVLNRDKEQRYVQREKGILEVPLAAKVTTRVLFT